MSVATLQLQLVGVTAERDHALQQLQQCLERCTAKQAEWQAKEAEWQAKEAEWQAKEAEWQAKEAEWQNRVAGLEAQVRHLQVEQRSSRGSTADAELPAAPGAAQMAAAEGGPVAAEAPQLAEGVDGEGQGAGAAAAGSGGEGAGAVADELSIPLSSLGLGPGSQGSPGTRISPTPAATEITSQITNTVQGPAMGPRLPPGVIIPPSSGGMSEASAAGRG